MTGGIPENISPTKQVPIHAASKCGLASAEPPLAVLLFY